MSRERKAAADLRLTLAFASPSPTGPPAKIQKPADEQKPWWMNPETEEEGRCVDHAPQGFAQKAAATARSKEGGSDSFHAAAGEDDQDFVDDPS